MITFSGEELGPSLLQIGVTLAIAAVVIAAVVWIARRRGSTTIAVNAVLTLSMTWILLSAIGAIVFVVRIMSGERYFELRGNTNTVFPWPTDLPCSNGGASGMLNCGSTALTNFSLTAPSPGVLAWATADTTVRALLFTLPALIIAILCWGVLRGRPFSALITRALYWGAAAVLIIGIASELLGNIAATAALRDVLTEASPWYPSHFTLQVSWLPALAALGLLALASIIRHGMRLQRERDALAKETEGLV